MSLRGVRGPGWPAQYGGAECPECYERIKVGELIDHAIGDGYRHVKCPEVEPEKPTKFQGTSLEEMGF